MNTKKTIKTTVRRLRSPSKAMRLLGDIIGKPMSISEILESSRLAEELTLAEFSKKLGVSAQHLSDIEKGRRLVSPARAKIFADKLGSFAPLWIELSIQDQLRSQGLKRFVVTIEEADAA